MVCIDKFMCNNFHMRCGISIECYVSIRYFIYYLFYYPVVFEYLVYRIVRKDINIEIDVPDIAIIFVWLYL